MIPKAARNQATLCSSDCHLWINKMISPPIALAKRMRRKTPLPVPLCLVNCLVMDSNISSTVFENPAPWQDSAHSSSYPESRCPLVLLFDFTSVMHKRAKLSCRRIVDIPKFTIKNWMRLLQNLDAEVTGLICKTEQGPSCQASIIKPIFLDRRWKTIGTRANFCSAGSNTNRCCLNSFACNTYTIWTTTVTAGAVASVTAAVSFAAAI